jgi:flagellin-like protein
MENRGLSNIIATVLIVLLAIVAVGVIWGFLNSSILEVDFSDVNSLRDSISIDKESVKINEDEKLVSFSVKRNSGSNAEISSLAIVLSDESGNSEKFVEEGLEVLESKLVEISYFGLTNLTEISIFPVFKFSGGKSSVGRIEYKYDFKGDEESFFALVDLEESTCNDSDSGEDSEFVFGETLFVYYVCDDFSEENLDFECSFSGNVFGDTCLDVENLVEFSCDENLGVVSEEIDCEFGCSQGRCLSLEGEGGLN